MLFSSFINQNAFQEKRNVTKLMYFCRNKNHHPIFHKNYMRKIISLLFIAIPLYAITQTINIRVTKNLGWAEWTYDTLEFKDDCTVLKGYFIPSEDGCWVKSNMDETLRANDVEYRIIYTTLPINRHPRTVYKGKSKVFFEEHFEPIFSTSGNVYLPSHDIHFSVPFKNRKSTKPFEDLFPMYEKHIDTLISQEKYGIASYLLCQYVKNVWLHCIPVVQKTISKSILLKYRVMNFFLNASPDDEVSILANFREIYRCLKFIEDNPIFKQLEEINRLQTNIRLRMNGTHPHEIIENCESLMPMIRFYGKFNKCYENSLALYRKALIMDGQTQRIPKLDKEIIEVCSHIYNKNAGQYLERLTNIASDLDILPSKTSYETNSSINIWKEVRDKAKVNFPNSWRYANALKEIAGYNYRHRHFDVALMQYLSIDSLYQLKRKEWISEIWYNHDILSAEEAVIYVDLIQKSLSRMIGSCYFQKGDVASAVKYDEKNPYYHFALGDYETLNSLCEDMYVESMKGLKGIIKNPTILSPGAYYEEIFDMAYAPALTTQLPYFAYKTNSIDLCRMAYNGTLVTKEFRLTAGNRLRQHLRTTKDSISKRYSAQIEKEMHNYRTMIKRHDLEALEKQWEIVHLQRDLIEHLDSVGSLAPLFPNWTDVRNSLKDDELAIEFIEIPLLNENHSMYGALTLRKDSEYPKMTPLFEEKRLSQVSDTTYYQCKEMTNLVWEPLQSELEGIKNIYFSPSGAFYNIGIEYLPGMEHYNIYRLSSTRELATKKPSKRINNAVLYGGLDYYARLGATIATKNQEILDKMHKERTNIRDMGLRGGKEYLKHTKVEVEKIGEELQKAKWVCLLDTASMGTEESFKSLSGKRIGCLHISTHGFYYTPEEAEDMKYDFLHLDNLAVSAEDKALTRSGLVLSGANHTLEGEELSEDVEDGILTAKEIADVDLSELDLVVLSACQTGLGDISQSEGVFGLQRGFKKAGVNSIMMSLWEIDDKSTQILMTQFYRNLLSGQSKRRALLSAQQHLRDAEGGKYDAPKYWAAFILLDAKEN